MPRKRKIHLPPVVEEHEENTLAEVVRPNFLNDANSRKLLEIVVEAQKNESYHEKCCKHVLKLYEKFQHKTFVLVTIHCLKFALIQHEDNEYGNCQLNFWACVLTSFDSSEDTHPVLGDCLNWLLNNISADSNVRFRMCFFVNLLLNAMGLDAQLDDHICNNIQTYMIERMRDINQNVRLQAVYALQRLQNPDDNEDKVIQVYMFHIDNDPSPKVRQAIITAVARGKKTIPFIIGRLWDVEEKVRRHTILQMSKHPVRNYMVAQRLKILEQGLKDQSPLVKTALTKVMLPHWIESYQRNYIHFLNSLKIDATDEELSSFKRVSTEALMELFKKFPLADITKCLHLNEVEPLEKCVALDNLNVESVVLWHAIIKYLKETDNDEIENVSPDLSTMAEYLFKYIEINQHKNEQSGDRYEKMYFQFVVEVLLNIINDYDFGDEVGRNKLKTTIFEILKTVNFNETVLQEMIKILENLINDSEQRLEQVVELIGSICDYSQNFDLDSAKKVVNRYLEITPDKDLEYQIRQKEFKILELKEQLSLLMNEKDYRRQESVNQEIEILIEDYKSLIKPIIESSTDENSLNLTNSLYRRKRLSNEVLIKCVQIFFYMVASENVKQLTPCTMELYRKLICIHFESQETNLRNWALRCGTSCALLYESLSKEVFEALWKQFVNTGSIKIWRTTIQCMFELIDIYGFDHFELEKEQQKNKRGRQLFSVTEDDETEEEESAGNFMNFMAHLTDNCEDVMKVIAHGYCRLILRGHLTSSDIIVKLLLKYFNPATENELSQSLGIFFENLIETKKQELLQQALLPTVNAIIEAPIDSPLAEIDIKKIIRFVIQSTRMVFCEPGLCIHNTLAMSFFTAMKDNDEDNNKELIKALAGELRLLEISDDTTLRSGFKTCAEELKSKFRDSKVIKSLTEFINIMDGKSVITFSSSRTPSNINGNTNGVEDALENGSDCEENAGEADDNFKPSASSLTLTNNDTLFKVPAAKSIPDFMKTNKTDTTSRTPTTVTNDSDDDTSAKGEESESIITPDTVERGTESQLNLSPFMIPQSQEDEEVQASPMSHQLVWSKKSRTRGIKLIDAAGFKRNNSPNSEQEDEKNASPKRKVTRKTGSDASVELKLVTRSANGISRPSLRKTRSIEKNDTNDVTVTTPKRQPNKKTPTESPKTPIRSSRISNREAQSSAQSTRVNVSDVKTSPSTSTRRQTETDNYAANASSHKRVNSVSSESSVVPRSRRESQPRTSSASPTAAKSTRQKKSSSASGVLPQSPINLIGTRSIATRVLRNRDKSK